MAGFPVWYELMTNDPAKAAPFYNAVLGWDIPQTGNTLPNGAQYREIARADGGVQGGVLSLSEEMLQSGARPAWVTYFHVPDTDTSLAAAKAAGATCMMEAMDMPGVGRLAMLTDPQGAFFYLMTLEGYEGQDMSDSGVFAPDKHGQCAWNELNTSNAAQQEAFYTSLLGWQQAGEMPMPGEYTYKLYNLGDTPVGAIGSMKPEGMPNAWLPYFRVSDIHAAKAAVAQHDGQIMMGPHEVPGDDMIIVAFDPQGAAVGLVGAKPA